MAYPAIPMAHHDPLSLSNTAQCQVCHTAAWHIPLFQALATFNSSTFVGRVGGLFLWWWHGEHSENIWSFFISLFFWVPKLYGCSWWEQCSYPMQPLYRQWFLLPLPSPAFSLTLPAWYCLHSAQETSNPAVANRLKKMKLTDQKAASLLLL